MLKNRILALGAMGGMLASLALASGCNPSGSATTPTSTGFDWTYIVLIVIMFVAFYFLLIRPQRRRQKEQQQLIAGLKQGDQVITAGGIYGEIVSVDEDSIVIKVESGTNLRVAKQSVAVRRPAGT